MSSALKSFSSTSSYEGTRGKSCLNLPLLLCTYYEYAAKANTCDFFLASQPRLLVGTAAGLLRQNAFVRFRPIMTIWFLCWYLAIWGCGCSSKGISWGAAAGRTHPESCVDIPLLSRKLSQLMICHSDAECGYGRTCYKSRCTGFAGNDFAKYVCSVGSECYISFIPGHFDSRVQSEKDGLSSAIYSLRLSNGYPSLCGNVDAMSTRSHREVDVYKNDHTVSVGASRYRELNQLEENENLLESRGAELRNAMLCRPVSGEDKCHAELGRISAGGQVGMFGLCGCSNVDVEGVGVPCSSVVDFNVPVGWLEIRGFSSPRQYTRSITPESHKGGSFSIYPEYYCRVGSSCLLSDFEGHGLDESFTIVAIPGDAVSCNSFAVEYGTNKSSDKWPFQWRCTSVTSGSRCAINVESADLNVIANQKNETLVKMCGCGELQSSNSFCEDPVMLGFLRVKSSFEEFSEGDEVKVPMRNLQVSASDTKELLKSISDFGEALINARNNIRNSLGGETIINRIETTINRLEIKCTSDQDCMGGTGTCVQGICKGFNIDDKDKNLIRCVEGYNCNIGKGDITGHGISETFQVIAVDLSGTCGSSQNLKKKESIFHNRNWWSCGGGDSQNCQFKAGVGFRRDKQQPVQGVRLCGCPGTDMNGDGVPCNHMRDFLVPLARLGVQECIDNAHCADNHFAYCVDDHCGGFLVSAAAVGLQVFNCIQNSKCTLESVAGKVVSESLKVIQVTNSFSCGSEVALDPNYFKDEALPCLVEKNGNCQINIGVTKPLGSSRLCGCSGQDLGGNGVPCDEAKDFDSDLGKLNLGECILSKDCKTQEICVEGNCVVDDVPPYIVKFTPTNDSHVMPPLKQIVLEWNENIKWGAVGKRVVVQSISDSSLHWIFPIPEKAKDSKLKAPRSSVNKYDMEIKGQKLILTPDSEAYSMPVGNYKLGYEFEFITDLQGNPNSGAADIVFSVTKGGECGYLYVTGFSTQNNNLNGVYEAQDSINTKISWKGGDQKSFYIYWKNPTGTQEGNWVMDTNMDDNNVLAFPDLEIVEKLSHEELKIPPTGLWLKMSENGHIQQHEVVIHCARRLDETFPTLTAIEPDVGQTGWPVDGVIKMTFSEYVTYGDSGNIIFIGRSTGHKIILNPTWEGGMRGKEIKIQLMSDAVREGEQEVGKVELHLPEPLVAGENYQIVIEGGALIDLAYLPFGPVENDTLVFRTYGAACPPYPDKGHGFEVALTEPDHGAVISVKCAPNYSVIGSSQEINEILCEDGVWKASEMEFDCKADCEEYQELEGQYIVEGRENGKHHGAKITLSCPSTVVQKGSSASSVTVSCNDGRWDDAGIMCGSTSCGPFPSLGISYKVYDPTDGNIDINATRTIECSSPAVPDTATILNKEVIICKEKGWSKRSLECNIPCNTPSLTLGEAYQLSGFGTEEGATRDISCSPNYQSITEFERGVLTCVEGKWINDKKIQCKSKCQEMSFGPGFNVDVVIGDGTIEGTEINLSCKPTALHESGPSSQRITCKNGAWSLRIIQCRAYCNSPLEQLGDKYRVISSPSNKSEQILHGETWQMACVEGSTAVDGPQPHEIVCDDGTWRSKTLQTVLLNGKGGINLDCKASCPVSMAAPFKVTAADPLSVLMYASNGGFSRVQRFKHHAKAYISCADGSSFDGNSEISQTLECLNGQWVPELSIHCQKDCDIEQLNKLDQNYDYSVFIPNGPMTHGASRSVGCNSGTIRLTGPKKDRTLCRNGYFSFPRLICGVPSCQDGLMNGDEKGTDCGGSLCSSQCLNTCTDGFKNGDEEDVDCGGSSCPACVRCTYPPTISNYFALSEDSGYTYVNKADIGISTDVRPGLQVHVQCAEGLMTEGSEPHERFGVVTCSNGEWNVDDLKLKCIAPSCSDKIHNGDELGVDCGGSCGSQCPTCYDGIQNSDEAYIDCGGSSCPECAHCSLAPLKPFLLNLNLYETNIINRPDIASASGTMHGVSTRIRCLKTLNEDTVSSVDLKCLNGVWLSAGSGERDPAVGLEEAIEQLRNLQEQCKEASRSGGAQVNTEEEWEHSNISSYEVPNLQTNVDRDDCMKVIVTDFSRKLEGECGALIYGDSHSKVFGFCEGSCRQDLEGRLQENRAKCSEDERTPEVEEVVALLSEILEVFCETRNHISTNEKEFCFGSAKFTLDAVLSLSSFVESRSNLQLACPASSCFRSNLRYIESLSHLSDYVNVDISADPESSAIKRRLQSVFHHHSMVSNSSVGGMERIADFPSSRESMWLRHLDASRHVTHAFGALGEALFTSFIQGLPLPARPTTRQLREQRRRHRRRLQYKEEKHADAFTAASSFFHSLSNVDQILDLLCLEVEGKSCASFVQDIVDVSPIIGASALSSKVSTSKHPCDHKCYSEVTRKMGQKLSDHSRRNAFSYPFDVALGMLMKSYGRLYCQQSFTEGYCGNLIFSDVFSPFSRGTQIQRQWLGSALGNYAPASPSTFASCTCPVEFIGDGDCDASCFNAECGWDGQDCLAYNMFPEVYYKLTHEFPLKSSCNPFRSDFNLLGIDPRTLCSKDLEAAINRHDCCLASSLEVLRDLLEFDNLHPLVQSGQIRLSNIHAIPFESQDADIFQTDRSISWIEQTFQVALDRTCSRGLRRSVVTLDFRIMNVDYEKLFLVSTNKQGKRDGVVLKQKVRKMVADELSIPVADVTELRTWPGSVDMKVVIDAGWLNNMESFKNDLEDLTNAKNGILATAFTDEIDVGLFNAYKENISSPIEILPSSISSSEMVVQLSGVNVKSAPPLPPYGTFGMEILGATLPRPSCTEDLGLSVSEGQTLSDMYVVRISGNAHGSTSEVACVEGHDVLSGVSPQKLLCDQGRWVASKGENKLKCRRPCNPYEEEDRAVLSSGYVLSGVGTTSGDIRKVYCSRGYKPSEESAATLSSTEQTIACENGSWDVRVLDCVFDSGSAAAEEARVASCLSQLNSLGDSYNSYQVDLEKEEKAPEVFMLGLRREFPITSNPLYFLEVTCHRGYTRASSNDSNAGKYPFSLTCLNDTLFVWGFDPIYSAPYDNEENVEKIMQEVEVFKKRLEELESLMPTQLTQTVQEALVCSQDVVEAPDPVNRPLSDVVLSAVLFGTLLVLLVIIVGSIWLCRRYNGMAKIRKWAPVFYPLCCKSSLALANPPVSEASVFKTPSSIISEQVTGDVGDWTPPDPRTCFYPTSSSCNSESGSKSNDYGGNETTPFSVSTYSEYSQSHQLRQKCELPPPEGGERFVATNHHNQSLPFSYRQPSPSLKSQSSLFLSPFPRPQYPDHKIPFASYDRKNRDSSFSSEESSLSGDDDEGYYDVATPTTDRHDQKKIS